MAAQGHDLDGLLKLTYYERMTQFIRGSTRHVTQGSTVLDFRPLYAVNLHHIQRQLAQKVAETNANTVSEDHLDVIGQLLDRYTRALKNFEYIHANRFETKFVKDIAASRIDNGPGSAFQAAMLKELQLVLSQPQALIYSDDDLLNVFNGDLKPQGLHTTTRGTKRRVLLAAQAKKAATNMSIRRAVFAILGGVAVVVPLLVLAIPSTPPKNLATVGVAIAIFAFASAASSSASPESLLATTAAYAAVLIVFIKD